MAIYIRCRHCCRLVPHQKGRCPCGASISPTRRNYYLSGRIDGKKVKKALGLVTLEIAKQKDYAFFRGGQRPRCPTWDEAKYAYCQKLELEGREKRYRRATAFYLNEMGRFWGDDRPLDELTSDLVRDYFYSLVQRPKPYKPASINRRLAAGRGAYKYTSELPNPFNKVRAIREVEKTAYLTDDQRTRLLDCALQVSRTLWEILQVCLHTGLRRMEVLTLKWESIDLDAGIAVIWQKGQIQRMVYLNEELKRILAAIERTGEYVWPGKNGGHLNEWWRRPLHRALKMAGLKGKITLHDLRHDFGTRIYRQTGDIRAAKELLGHAQLSTTMRYAHALPEHLKEVMEKLWGSGAPHRPDSPIISTNDDDS